MHGYEMHQLLQKLPGLNRVWALKQALVYAKLDKLEKNGLIAPYTNPDQSYIPPRKYFQITESGRIALDSWFQQPVLRSRLIRQEFLVKLLILRELDPEMLPEVLDKQIEVVEKWVESLKKELIDEAGDHIGDWMITSFRLLQDQAMLDWLHEVKTQLSQNPTHLD